MDAAILSRRATGALPLAGDAAILGQALAPDRHRSTCLGLAELAQSIRELGLEAAEIACRQPSGRDRFFLLPAVLRQTATGGGAGGSQTSGDVAWFVS